MKKLKIIGLLFMIVACTYQGEIKQPTTPTRPITPIVKEPPEKPTFTLIPWASLTQEEWLGFKLPYYAPQLSEYKDRLNIYQSQDYIEFGSIDYPNFAYQFSEVEDNIFQNQFNNHLTYQEMIDDINQLADILRYGFGGLIDSVSIDEFEEHMQWIKRNIPEEGLSLDEFRHILIVGLHFIKDHHLWIDRISPTLSAQYYVENINLIEEIDTQKLKHRYPIYAYNLKLIKDTQNKYYDIENGKQVIDQFEWFKPILDTDGTLYYSVVYHDPYYPYVEPKTITYDDGSQKELYYSSFDFDFIDIDYQESRIRQEDDLVYLDFTGFVFQSDQIPELHDMIDAALASKVVVIDVRGNIGGTTSLADELIYALIEDEKDTWPYFGHNYDTINPTKADEIFDINPELEFIYENLYIIYSSHDSIPVKSDRLIIVLMDNNTASAGEYFIGELKRYPNALFLGHNTAGLATSMVGQLYMLTHSTITLRVPIELNVYHPKVYSVRTGYEPDLWLTSFDLEQLINTFKNLP